MNKLIILAASVAMATPAMAQAQTSPNGQVLTNTPEMAAGYETRGQCQAAFRQLRNDQRRSGDRGGPAYDNLDNGDYNRASRETTRCEELDDGRYYIVFSADGF